MSIHKKIIAARQEFHSTSIVKTGWNEFSKYKYFELSDFLLPAMEILAKHDLIAITSFETELATMTVTDTENGESLTITSPMSTANLKACQPVQSMGACQTFVRRYLYTTLFEIVEHDVIEEQTGKPEPKAKTATKEQMAVIDDYRAMGGTSEQQNKWLDDNAGSITERQAANIITKLEADK